MFEDETYLARADWPLLQNGAVNLFWSPQIQREAQQALSELGYEVSVVSCEDGWERFREQFSSLLNWEEQFGYSPWSGNLDALNDGLSGYPFGPSRRAALALTGFHALVRTDKKASHIILDLLESHARDHLLFGRVLIMLVQTDDNRFECAEVGGRHPVWNRREGFDRNRGL